MDNYVTEGHYIGSIRKIENGIVFQKAGRDPDVLTKHLAKLLTQELRIDDMAEIKYVEGIGVVIESSSSGGGGGAIEKKPEVER